MYKVIIFDFFGVFCAPIATNWFRKTVPDDAVKLAAFQALCTESDYGRLPRDQFNQETSKLTGVPVEQVVTGIEGETIINTELVDYVKQLMKNYKIVCLSNGTREWTLRVIIDHGLTELFDEVVLSGDLGIVKPSPEIYTYTLEKLYITADQAILVDDREVNIEAAEALGIRSLLFSDTKTFIAEFEKLAGTR